MANISQGLLQLGEGLGKMAKARAKQIETELDRLHDENMVRLRDRLSTTRQKEKEGRDLKTTMAAEKRSAGTAVVGEKRRAGLARETAIVGEKRRDTLARQRQKDYEDRGVTSADKERSQKLVDEFRKISNTLAANAKQYIGDAGQDQVYLNDVKALAGNYLGAGVLDKDRKEIIRLAGKAMYRAIDSDLLDVPKFIRDFMANPEVSGVSSAASSVTSQIRSSTSEFDINANITEGPPEDPTRRAQRLTPSVTTNTDLIPDPNQNFMNRRVLDVGMAAYEKGLDIFNEGAVGYASRPGMIDPRRSLRPPSPRPTALAGN